MNLAGIFLGSFLAAIIDNYGERHEVLTGINRVDIVPYQQSPTFKLDKSHKKAHIKRAFFYIEQII